MKECLGCPYAKKQSRMSLNDSTGMAERGAVAISVGIDFGAVSQCERLDYFAARDTNLELARPIRCPMVRMQIPLSR